MTYVYRCKNCGKVFEMSGSMTTLNSVKLECPDCKTNDVQKVISPIASILKGDGFYRTDNRKKHIEMDE
jgi:putative FmdB family regulatory protein